MKRALFSVGILTVALACLTGCGQRKPAEAPKAAASKVESAAPNIETAVPPAPVAPATAAQAPAAPKPEIVPLVVADFNSGSKPNNVGGDFGSWNKDPNDPTQGCAEKFNSDERYGKDGYSLELDYDVDSLNPAYCGFWMKLDNKDVSQYNMLVFYIKGDEKAGYPQRMKIELKNAKGEVGKTYITQISPTWSPVEVPFSNLQGIKDFSNMTEFTIVFEDSASRPKTGKIYIDNVGFARQ